MLVTDIDINKYLNIYKEKKFHKHKMILVLLFFFVDATQTDR